MVSPPKIFPAIAHATFWDHRRHAHTNRLAPSTALSALLSTVNNTSFSDEQHAQQSLPQLLVLSLPGLTRQSSKGITPTSLSYHALAHLAIHTWRPDAMGKTTNSSPGSRQSSKTVG
jgi:hypothetical protein